MRVVSSAPQTARQTRTAHDRVDAASDDTPRKKQERQVFGEADEERERAPADLQAAARDKARRQEREAREQLRFQPMVKVARDGDAQPAAPALGYGRARSWAKQRAPSEHPARAAARAGYQNARDALRAAGLELREAKARWVDGEPEAARARARAALQSLGRALSASARARVDVARATFAAAAA